MYKFFIVLCMAYVVTAIDIHTGDNMNYQFFPVSHTSIHFVVKAANDAHIGLATRPHHADPMVEIVIGGWRNSHSAIRRLFKYLPDKVTAKTPGILSGNEHRAFWVSWAGGVISVGREGEYAPFMTWTDPHPFHVNNVGVHTGLGATGSWVIEEDGTVPPPCNASDNVIVSCKGCKCFINTEDKFEYKFFPVSHRCCKSLHFKVKAANDAHIALTTGFHESDQMVEIAIGGWRNTNSVIRRMFESLPDKVTAETPGILSGSELRGFWVSWDGGDIMVGREGEYAPFMSWTDPKPFHVAYVGVHTGLGATGFWIFEGPSSSTV